MDIKDVVVHKSSLSVKETTDKLEFFLRQHGVTIYTRIDQQAEANKSGLSLQPLEFLLFGNPQKGGSLMAANPMIALDLPLKIIVWQDNTQVYIAFNEARYITSRYGVDAQLAQGIDLEPIVAKALAPVV